LRRAAWFLRDISGNAGIQVRQGRGVKRRLHIELV
jgi:hypothetical protein